MRREPIIFLMANELSANNPPLVDIVRQRYLEGYRTIASHADEYPDHLIRQYHEQGDQIAVIVCEQSSESVQAIASFLIWCHDLYPDARVLLLTTSPATEDLISEPTLEGHLYRLASWLPPEQSLYPMLDELLADWRASVDMPYALIQGIMTVRAVRVRVDDSLHRAAEVIALSGVGDLMVIDENNNFVGVLSVGDVLRAAMPDLEEIMDEGGTLDQAFRLFLRKGSELMYRPIEPLVIRNPLVVEPGDHVAKAATLMLQRNIHRLPVVKDGRLVGTVGRTDICQAVVGTL